MREKIGIIVSGTSGIDYLDINFPVEVVQLSLFVDKKEYEDYTGIKADALYDIMVKNPDIDLSTSQPPAGKFVDAYKKMKDQGYSDVIVITVSSGLSGTIQAAKLAADIVDGINIYPFDSKSLSYGEVGLVIRANELINEGKNVEEILKELEKTRDKASLYFVVETLKYLLKNGRLAADAGLAKTLIKTKPLLKIQDTGKIGPYEKFRTTSKAKERLIQIINDETRGKKGTIFIACTNNKEEGHLLAKEFLKENENRKVVVTSLTPAVGLHMGPGTFLIGYFLE